MMTSFELTDSEKKALEYIRSEAGGIEDHAMQTREYALELNAEQDLGLDPGRLGLAALCHDLARLLDPDEITNELESRGIDPETLGHCRPVLNHDELSAIYATEKLGITDETILTAIRNHATGRAEMSLFDKVVYIADKLERSRKWPGVTDLRLIAEADVVTAFPHVVSAVIMHVLAEFWPLDYNSVSAYNSALESLKSDG